MVFRFCAHQSVASDLKIPGDVIIVLQEKKHDRCVAIHYSTNL